MTGGAGALDACGLVPAPRDDVFAFLARLDGHWRLADRWIEVVAIDADHLGGRVRMRGPLGLRRTATTRVDEARPPAYIHGTAQVGATRAHVTWTLAEAGASGGATRVHLQATVLEAAPLDRMLLAAGGRLWLRRRLRATLGALAAHFGRRGGTNSST